MTSATKIGVDTTTAASLGLTAAVPFVLATQLDEFVTLRDGLHSSIQPEGALEHLFFSRLVHAAWTLHRCDIAEAASAPSGDPLASTDPAAFHHAVALDQFRSRAERTLYRCTRELRLLQKERSTRDLMATLSYPVPAEVVDAIPPMAPAAKVIEQTHPPSTEAALRAERRAQDRQTAAHFAHRMAKMAAAAAHPPVGTNEANFAFRSAAAGGR